MASDTVQEPALGHSGASSASSRYGDPSSLWQYEATALEAHASPLLSLPLELWIHIFDGKVDLSDLTKLRGICKALWRVADLLMPHVARQMVPMHADDPRTADPFFAEAVIAAHRLNVRTPFEVMIARDGNIRPPPGTWRAPSAEQEVPAGKSAAASSTAAALSERAAEDEEEALPLRAKWIIGSRRMLHLLYVQGREWMFQVCVRCNLGECVRCQQNVKAPSVLGDAWWSQVPARSDRFEPFSNAILATDAHFCELCKREEREYTRLLDVCGTAADVAHLCRPPFLSS